MVWQINVFETAEKQLAKLDRPVAQRIRSFLRERVSILDGPGNVGEALKGSELDDFWKYRVGDWSWSNWNASNPGKSTTSGSITFKPEYSVNQRAILSSKLHLFFAA